MSQRNREKRAAKERERRRRGRTPARDRGEMYADGFAEAGWRPPPFTPSVEELGQAVLEAARAQNDGDRAAGPKCATELCNLVEQRTAGAGAGLALQHVVSQIWTRGWLPVDLWQVVRRRLDPLAVSLLTDSVAIDIARYPQVGMSTRWTAQLRQLEAEVWWDRASPHLVQWAERAEISLERAVRTLVDLLALLIWLPQIPRIEPLPGKATGSRSGAHGVDAKVLERVRGLLAKAESTSFPEEAEALSAKAQELMNRHAFERALLDDTQERPQVASSTRIWLDSPYLDAKASLVNVVAQANRSRLVQHGNLGFVSLVGDELDLEIIELLSTSLLVQATSAMVAEGKQVTRDGTSRTRSFRQSFLLSYANRIGERLTEADTTAREAADDPRLLPVLADRSEAVEAEFERMFGDTVAKSVSVSNGRGWEAGRAAADRADLGLRREEVTR